MKNKKNTEITYEEEQQERRKNNKWYAGEDWSEEDTAFVDEMLGKVWGDDYDDES